MPLSKNINAYEDVRAILDQVRPHGFGTYKLPTPGKARQWLMRAYQFRKLEQEQGRVRAGVKGYTPETPYDLMKLVLKGNSVEIDFAPKPEGRLTLPTGETILPEVPSRDRPPPSNKLAPLSFKPLTALEEAAKALAAEQGDED